MEEKTYFQQMLGDMHLRRKKHFEKSKEENKVLGIIQEQIEALVLCVNDLNARLQKLEESP